MKEVKVKEVKSDWVENGVFKILVYNVAMLVLAFAWGDDVLQFASSFPEAGKNASLVWLSSYE